MKKLPVGVQTFQKLIEYDYLYIDKTQLIFNLIDQGEAYFLARPRRFGKSLLLSTLHALFRGKKTLFNDLQITQTGYHWETFPVISLDFSLLTSDTPEALEATLQAQLQRIADEYAVGNIKQPYLADSFITLITQLAKIGPVVILIDEYDHPLVSHLGQKDLVESNRKSLAHFFGVIKGLERFLRFIFVTGVSKFSKVSLFSGMNNLRDISLSHSFSSLLGLTEDEIRLHLAENLHATAHKRQTSITDLLSTMRRWYNGYLFSRISDAEKVYNPLSVMLFLSEQEFGSYWFGTATPTFALNMIRDRQYRVANFEEGVAAGSEIEESHEVETLDLISLLFQTGYLTISKYDERSRRYTLTFPNEEVKRSFLEHLLRSLTFPLAEETRSYFPHFESSLKNGDLEQFFSAFNNLLAAIPYEIHVAKESYYHSLLYVVLRAFGFQAESEVMTGGGRIDLVIEFPNRIFLFEFKINQSAEKALKQIKERGYYQRYQGLESPVTLVGANFDTNARQLSEWLTEQL